MAAIDKMYANKKEYDQLKAWATKNAPVILRYFYEWESEYKPDDVRPVTNFPTWADKLLYNHCDVEWAKAQILENYGGDVEYLEGYSESPKYIMLNAKDADLNIAFPSQEFIEGLTDTMTEWPKNVDLKTWGDKWLVIEGYIVGGKE